MGWGDEFTLTTQRSSWSVVQRCYPSAPDTVTVANTATSTLCGNVAYPWYPGTCKQRIPTTATSTTRVESLPGPGGRTPPDDPGELAHPFLRTWTPPTAEILRN
eukprot:2304453-Rhodomonas_salina.1